MKRRLEDDDTSNHYPENWMCSPASSGGLHPCFLCEKILLSSEDLKTHLEGHNFPQSSLVKENSVTTTIFQALPMEKLKKLPCDVCGQIFENVYDLKLHQIQHFGDEKYKCLVCLKSFSTKGSFHRHQHTHIKEKTFLCTRCPKIFKNKTTLQLHLMAHDGKKPYTCHICQQPFGL